MKENKITEYLELLLESKKDELSYHILQNKQPRIISEIELLEEILHEIKNNL